MDDSCKIVGDVLEEKLMGLFSLDKYDNENKVGHPDLISKSKSFCMEAKASSCMSGAMIKQRQLVKFKRTVKIRRFYAFGFHSIVNGDLYKFKKEKELRESLEFKSFYIFPFSIVLAHYDNSEKKEIEDDDHYVTLVEGDAENIFSGERRKWKNLQLNTHDYKRKILYKKVYLITNCGNLEGEMTRSFNPEFL